MKLIISRTKRYGGITSFLLNFLENSHVSSEDILLLDVNISSDIISKIKENYGCKIIFFPESSTKRSLIITRFLQGRFIEKIKKNNKNINKIIFIDWNLILDWYIHTKKYEIISFVHTYPTRLIPKFLKYIINYFIRNTKIITVSKYSANQISKKWQINQNDIEILYNFSNLPGNAVTRTLSIYKNIDIVTIAHCEPYKNPQLWYQVALEVTRINQNIVFHWYGDGSLFEEYRKLASGNNNIIFHGYSKKIDVILNEKTTIYLQCSKIESLGISILDAMNYSLPVIILDNGGMPELISNNENGYICRNKEELIGKILESVSKNEKYTLMSNKSKEIYEKQFTEKNWIQDLTRIMDYSGKSDLL